MPDPNWTGPTDSDGEPCNVRSTYECVNCDTTWTSTWSCACDDRCPGCNRPIEASGWVTIDSDGIEVKES